MTQDKEIFSWRSRYIRHQRRSGSQNEMSCSILLELVIQHYQLWLLLLFFDVLCSVLKWMWWNVVYFGNILNLESHWRVFLRLHLLFSLLSFVFGASLCEPMICTFVINLSFFMMFYTIQMLKCDREVEKLFF
jgi:hypothetical protein